MLPEFMYSLRNLSKAPAFATTAILTLALGIGASTAVFTVVDSVVLKPLTYPDSGKLVVIWERVKFLANEAMPYVGPNARHETIWKDRSSAFSGLCLLGVGTRGISLTGDHPQLVGSMRVQPNFLNILEVAPHIGRNFVPDDAIKGHDEVAIITYPLWQTLFHADPNVIGKKLRVADVPYRVIGVLPANFHFPKRSVLNAWSKQSVAAAPPIEMLTPLVIDPTHQYGWNSDYGNLLAIARLKPGVTARQAEAQLNLIQQQIVNEMPADQRDNSPNALLAYVQPLQEAMVGGSRRALWMLMAAVIGLMLIACVNLANAQLGRAVSREREAAIRSALGGTKWQLIWISLSESLVLALIGGAAGILLAFNTIDFFARHAPVDLPRMTEIHPNLSVLLFALLVVIGSALLFGVMPAMHFVRTDPQEMLQQNSARMQGSRRGRRTRLVLIGLQVFGCTALLLVTGLFAKSLATLLQSDRGFDSGNIVTAEVNLPTQAYANNQQRIAFDDAVIARLRELPGVTSAALVSAMPLEGETWINGIFRPDKPTHNPPLANFRWVSSDYFRVLHQRLSAGRFFEERDRDSDNAVISEAAAKAVWPNEDPVGRPFKWRDKVFTVIGVVADSRMNSLKLPPANMVYLPYRTLDENAWTFMVRTVQSPETLIPDIRRAIWEQDPEVTIVRVKTLDSQVKDSVSTERFQTFILMAFGLAALLLAMLGIYGILSYTVAGRTQEFGLRMALGATRQSIYSLTMTEAGVPVVFGLIAGWAASALAGKLVEKLLYGITAIDWSVTAIVVIVFIVCATAAAFVPARRAARIDPMQALRTE
jgi:predicted permease